MTQSLPISVLTSDCCDWLRNRHVTSAGQSEPSQVLFFFFASIVGQKLSFLGAAELEGWEA